MVCLLRGYCCWTCIIGLSEWNTVSKCVCSCVTILSVYDCTRRHQWPYSQTLQSEQGDLWYGNLSLCRNLHQCHYSPCASGERDWSERMEGAEFIEMLQRYSQKSFTWLLAARSHEYTQRSRQMCAFPQNKGIWEQDCETGSVMIEWKIISRCPWRLHLRLRENWSFFLFSLICTELKRRRLWVSLASLKLLDVNQMNSITLWCTFFRCHFCAKIHHCVKIQPQGVTSMAQASFSALLLKKSVYSQNLNLYFSFCKLTRPKWRKHLLLVWLTSISASPYEWLIGARSGDERLVTERLSKIHD